MLSYIKSCVLYYVRFFISTLFLYNLTSNFGLYSNIPDLLYKVRLNDYFFCNFYFFWTNLQYLPLLFFIFLLIFLMRINAFIPILLPVVILFIFAILAILLLDSNYMCCSDIELETFSTGVNKLLNNSINKIHPPLLYYSVLWVFYGLGYTSGIYRKFLFYKNMYFTHFFKTTMFYLISCITALYLGSWWALQEGSWGGWWNWDSSEVFGVIIFFKLITIYHFYYFSHRTELTVLYIQSSCFIIFIFYLFMQLNFGLISHNFSSKNYQLASLDLFYILLIVFGFLTFFKLWFNYKTTYSYFYRYGTSYLNKTTSVIKYLVITTLYLSLLPLINNFLWYKINLNLINYPPNFFKITLMITVVLLTTVYYNNNYLSVLLPLWSSLGGGLKVALFIKIPKLLVFSRNLHYALLLIFIYSLFLSFSLTTDWSYGSWLNINHIIYALALSTDHIYLDFNSISNFNSLEGRSFNLFFKGGVSNQNFYITQQITKSSMSTIDLLPSLLSSLYLVLYLFFIRLLLLKCSL